MAKKILVTIFLVLAGENFLYAQESPLAAGGGNQEFEGFHLTGYTKEGEKSWDVKGEQADIDGSLIKLTKILAVAYGDEQINLTADTGNMDQSTGNMHLEKNVVITSETGSQMTTNSVDWQKEKDLVTTEDQVNLNSDRMWATGTGLEAHPSLKVVQLKENVTVNVKTELNKVNGKIVTITCDGPLDVDQLKDQAVFNKNVVAVQDERKIKADRLEVNFDPVLRQIKDMISTGHVEITQNGNTTHSEKAVYTGDNKKMILSGRPKLIFNIEGEKKRAASRN